MDKRKKTWMDASEIKAGDRIVVAGSLRDVVGVYDKGRKMLLDINNGAAWVELPKLWSIEVEREDPNVALVERVARRYLEAQTAKHPGIPLHRDSTLTTAESLHEALTAEGVLK